MGLCDGLQSVPTVKTEGHHGDPLVTNTVSLLAHKRALDR